MSPVLTGGTALLEPAPPAAPPPAGPAVAQRFRRRWPLLLATLLAAAIVGLPVPVAVHAVAGLWLLFGAPIVLLYALADALVSTRDGRLILAVGGAVLGDIVMALLTNTVLPVAGLDHPLTRIPLTCSSVLFIGVLAAVAPAPAPRRWTAPGRVPGLQPVLSTGLVAVVLSIAGPIRLNNGLGNAASMAALGAVAALITLLFVRRRRYGAPVTGAGIFFVALSLLLLTSLRGWYITGHDIQREYGVFQLTYQTGRWDIADFRDAYNACLSINLLPTSIARLTGISGIHVFKAVIPVLFAVAPVALYRAVRHGAPQSVAILSAVYFVAFPTFFTDMAFLARQEVAFLLLGCVLVLLADGGRPLRTRQIAVTVLLAGLVLTHYSTTYVVLAVFGAAYVLGLAWRLAARRGGRSGVRRAAPVLITWWMIAVAAVAAVLWTGAVTHTGGQARSTAGAAVLELLGRRAASGSSDTAYSIVGGERITAAQRLAEYTRETAARTAAARAGGAYLPLDVVDRYPATAVEQPAMPLTAAGRVLAGAGVDVAGLNTLVRLSAARLLQVLLLVGLILAVTARRPVFRATSDQILLCAGALGLIGVLTVLPELSVDYGVLRAFQQGLFFFAPFIAAASIWIFRWARRWATGLAFTMALLLFLDLVGVVPQLLGGYPPQLHLANAGQYYDIYYLHPEERSAISWLQSRASEADREHVQSEIQTDRYTFGRVQSLLRDRAADDFYPTLIGADTYVFLGFTAVHKGEATLFYRGDLVTYRYPAGLLDETKNKIYSSEDAEVYR